MSTPTFHPRASLMLEEAERVKDTFFVRTETPTNGFASFYDVPTFLDYYAGVPAPQRNLYEFITEKMPRRLYFDIEYMSEREDEGPLECILLRLETYFETWFNLTNIEWQIATSSGVYDAKKTEVKNSFHVLLKGYFTRNHKAMRQIIDHMKSVFGSDVPGLDFAPYGKTQGLRLFGSSKRARKAGDLMRVKRAYPGSSDDIIDHLISFVGRDEEIPMVPFLAKINEHVSRLPLRRGTKRKRPSEDSGCYSEEEDEDIGTRVVSGAHSYKFNFFKAEALLALLDASYYEEYEKWINVGIALKQYGEECLLLFEEFSAKSDKYNKKECHAKWNSFPDRPNIGCQSLIYWARECNAAAVDDIFAHVKRPVRSKYMRATFGHERLQQILKYVDDRATAERICVQFMHATAIFCLNNGNGIYMLKQGPNDYRPLDVAKYEKMTARYLCPSYNYSAEEYVDNMLNSDSNQIPQPRVEMYKLHHRIQDKITADEMVFDPTQTFDDNSRVINRFYGYRVTRRKGETFTLDPGSKMYRIFNHCNNVICGRESLAVKDFFFGWLNRVLNHPGSVPGIALLLHSLPGCGKNVFTKFLQNVIGSEYTWETTETRLFQKFNSQLENRILVIGNEIANGSLTKRKADLLKDMITTDHIDIESKGMNVTTQPNFANFVLTTNNNRPLQVDQGDRRMLILSLKDTYIGDYVYFDALVDAIEDDESVSDFLTWLYAEYNDREWRPQHLPMTKLKQDMMIDSAPVSLQFVLNNRPYFTSLEKAGGYTVDALALDERFRQWTERNMRYRATMPSRTFLGDMQRYLGARVTDHRHKANETKVDFKNLAYMEEQIKLYFGHTFQW